MLGMPNSKVLWVAAASLVWGGCGCPTACVPDPCRVWRGPTTPCATPCATVTPTAAATGVKPLPAPGIKPSGFLDDYSGLRGSPDHEGSYSWTKEGIDLRVYDHLLIDPVVVILDEEGQKIVTEEMRATASEAFREILLETIEPFYEVVDVPAEHVLRVRLALTDLVPTPQMEEGKPAVQTGGAELEGIFSDALTGETLMRIVSRIEGSGRGEDAKPEWQAVEGAFYEWADRLLTFLDSFKE